MRIGELARIVGITTRAIRHYHHLGLLAEPERRGNGYRDYGLRHAVELARIRRLTELGLGLAEVRDALADDAGRDLVEVLTELDDDLARQESALRERRARLRALLDDARRQGGLPAGGPLSPELAAFLAGLGEVDPDSPMAAKDREVLALVDATAPPEDRARLMAVLTPVLTAPGALDAVRQVYALLDALAGAGPDDPRVAGAARALVACLPADLPTPRDVGGHALVDAFLADFSPGQAAAVRLAMRLAEEGR
ncbi:MerR family transcriptional regulator [Streptomyces sp. NPDC088785]|uniref:MerR family transcriptional regulator n=1 Tax=Streptomyces sp. NPDC088785 TaxID=3365897 RepID=UPI0038250CB7